MAVIGTGLLEAAIRGEFFERFTAGDVQAFYQGVTTPIKSTSDTERYRWIGTVPQMREWGTGRKAKGLNQESYDVENLKYEATLEVDRDQISDDKLGQINIRTRELALRAATHKDYLLGQLLINGSSAGYNSYDGVPFFDGSHVSGASGSQSNEGNFDVGTVAGANLFDEPASTTLFGPQTALAAYNNAISKLRILKDDQGEYLNRTPGAYVVVCHPAKEWTFRRAFGAVLLPQVGSNVLPPGGAPGVVPLPDLDATGAHVWYLLRVDGAVRPFIFQDREAIEFTAMERDSDEGFLREKYLYGVRARYRITYAMWQHAYATTMTT